MLMTTKSPSPFLVRKTGSIFSLHNVEISLYSFLSAVDGLINIVSSICSSAAIKSYLKVFFFQAITSNRTIIYEFYHFNMHSSRSYQYEFFVCLGFSFTSAVDAM